MVGLVAVAQALEDQDGVRDTRLLHLDRLEAPFQRGVALHVLAVLILRRGPDQLERAPRKAGLEDVGGVHRALGVPGADDGVHLVHEQDDVAGVAELLDDAAQPFLELAAVLRPRDEVSRIKLNDALALQRLRDRAVGDLLSQPLDHGGLAHARVAYQDGVALGPAAEHLHDAAYLALPADDGVQLAVPPLLGEVDAQLVQRGGPGPPLLPEPVREQFDVLLLGVGAALSIPEDARDLPPGGRSVDAHRKEILGDQAVVVAQDA